MMFREIDAFYFYPRPPGGGRRRDLSLRCRSRTDFYPRPPGGGRPICSTFATFFSNFYPRPPGGGRPRQRKGEDAMTKISIHALRVEGDSFTAIPNEQSRNFYPRPPGGGRLWFMGIRRYIHGISIHALRVEGDGFAPCMPRKRRPYFYPRPPGGGRPRPTLILQTPSRFLSTPSGWRATEAWRKFYCSSPNFYPRPPGGGRLGTIRFRSSD